MKHGMRLGDYLDLEWFLEKDRTLDPMDVLERDRAIGLAAASVSIPPEQHAAYWLGQRREAHGARLPSGSLGSILFVLRLALGMGGLLAGISLVRALLLYSGVAPVNVSVFLLLAVFPQVGFILLATGFMLVRGIRHSDRSIPLRRLFELFWIRPGSLSPQAGFVRSLFLRRGWPARMLGWEGLRLAHLGGLCLALGSLAGLIVSVAVTDLAFGWQSTLQVGAQGMHSLVVALSLPWSWLPQEWGLAPTLGQIEGSRIILKDGIEALASADLVAWWPFLGMCLLSYALLPRFVLLASAHWMLRRLEQRFEHPDLARIVDRMQAPRIGFARAGEAPSTVLPLGSGAICQEERLVTASGAGVGCVLLMPPELAERIDAGRLSELTQRVCGHPDPKILLFALDPEDIRQALEECSGLDWTGGHERFVVLIEAWQPPIRENLHALKLLADESGRSVILALCGRPNKETWLTAPSEAEREVWTDAAARLAPLRVDIFGADV
jgi:hypothetical protein